MPQFGKYSTDRDNILHFLCTSGWANDTFGDVEAPTGFVSRISNNPADVHLPNTEITSLIEDQLALYDITDDAGFRRSLEGHFLVIEDDRGLVTVRMYADEEALKQDFRTLRDRYETWAAQDEEEI